MENLLADRIRKILVTRWNLAPAGKTHWRGVGFGMTGSNERLRGEVDDLTLGGRTPIKAKVLTIKLPQMVV